MTNTQVIPIDESFERSYDLELLIDVPNSALERYYFPPGTENSGPVLRVTSSKGERFLAIVAGSAEDFRTTTWPNPDVFLTIPALWLIDTASPSGSEPLPIHGHALHYFYPIVDRELVLVGDCCEIHCYGPTGKIWGRDDFFCCEDPRIEVAGDRLLLTAHKHGEDPEDTAVLKQLDLLTGKNVTA
jgi:hypothetical protein